MPGAISPATGLVKNANSTWLNGRPFRHDVARALGRPVALANDADCFALSGGDRRRGGGGARRLRRDPRDGGRRRDRRRRPAARRAERDRGRVGAQSPALARGRRAARAALLLRTRPAASRPSSPGRAGPRPRAGRSAAGKGGAPRRPRSRRGPRPATPAAGARSCCYEQRLARALAHVINLLDPHAIVLGGGLSALPSLYERVPRALVALDLLRLRRDPAPPAAARRRQRRARRGLARSDGPAHAGLKRSGPRPGGSARARGCGGPEEERGLRRVRPFRAADPEGRATPGC